MVKQGLYRRGRSSSFHEKFEPKFWHSGLASRVRQIGQKINNTRLCEHLPGEPLIQIKNFFLIEPRRLAASVEGLNNSLAIAAGEL